MLKAARKVFGRNYEPLNRIEISLSNLASNYNYLSNLNKNIKVGIVVKSNAYGHGLKLLAKDLDKLNAPFFFVDSLYEAYELLKENVKTPVLIMGFVDPESLKTKKLPFSFAVYNMETLNALNKYQPEVKIHIFVDTGMHREGVRIEELEKFIRFIIDNTNLEIEGLMSHLADSDHPENSLTQQQINDFEKAYAICQRLKVYPKWIHLGNSSAVISSRKFPKICNLGRAGLAFYGIDPQFDNNNLKPALRLISKVSQIKDVFAGEKVGYDFDFTAERRLKIATLPIGYFDGVDRRLSSKGFVKVKDKYCRIIGRVSMNITIIDVTDVLNIEVGDEVLVFSDKRTDKNSIENSAKLSGILQYELPVHLDSSIRRELRA